MNDDIRIIDINLAKQHYDDINFNAVIANTAYMERSYETILSTLRGYRFSSEKSKIIDSTIEVIVNIVKKIQRIRKYINSNIDWDGAIEEAKKSGYLVYSHESNQYYIANDRMNVATNIETNFDIMYKTVNRYLNLPYLSNDINFNSQNDIISFCGSFLIRLSTFDKEFIKSLGDDMPQVVAEGISTFTSAIQRHSDSEIKEAIAAQETRDTVLGVQELDKFWNKEMEIHQTRKRIFFVAFIIISVAMVCIVEVAHSNDTYVYYEISEALLHYLKKWGLLLLLTVWVLRLISRQFITQLALEEDARLRSKLITTFTALQRNPDTGVDEKERAHMIEAIFRPLPITPSTDVQAPSFADIIKFK